MKLMKTPITLLFAGSIALSGCTTTDSTGDNSRTKSGALIGAGIGAILGGTRKSGSNRLKSAAVGAAIGAGAGALVGSMLDRQAADLRRSMGSKNVDIVNTGSELIVTMPQDILFATDSAALRPALRADLRALAQNLLDYPDTRVAILGHTDNTGTASYNQSLSGRRASVVASVLRNSGVPSYRLRAYGRGEDEPIASNLTSSGRHQNRRVEIVIRPTS